MRFGKRKQEFIERDEFKEQAMFSIVPILVANSRNKGESRTGCAMNTLQLDPSEPFTRNMETETWKTRLSYIVFNRATSDFAI